jgi:hypothetical protein
VAFEWASTAFSAPWSSWSSSKEKTLSFPRGVARGARLDHRGDGRLLEHVTAGDGRDRYAVLVRDRGHDCEELLDSSQPPKSTMMR